MKPKPPKPCIIGYGWVALNEDGHAYVGSLSAGRKELIDQCNAGRYGILMPTIVRIEMRRITPIRKASRKKPKKTPVKWQDPETLCDADD